VFWSAGARKLESSYGPGGGFTGRLGSRKSSGMVRSSYEEEQVVLQLQAVERMKDMCKVCPCVSRMLVYTHGASFSYENHGWKNNRRYCGPCVQSQHVSFYHSCACPWSEVELLAGT